MLRGETTSRSDLTPESLSARLQAHGVERLQGERLLGMVLDGSDLRKSHATAMDELQRVKHLEGRGTVASPAHRRYARPHQIVVSCVRMSGVCRKP